MALRLLCRGIRAWPSETVIFLISPSGCAAARSSSAEPRATSWNRDSRRTAREISNKPDVTSFSLNAPRKTSTRQTAEATSSGRYPPSAASSPSTTAAGSRESPANPPSPDSAAHCFASIFTSSADRRRSWTLSTRNKTLLGRQAFSLSQIAFTSPDESWMKLCQGTKIAKCCTAALICNNSPVSH